MSLPPSERGRALFPVGTESIWYVIRGCCTQLAHVAGLCEEQGDPENLYLELKHLSEVVRLLWLCSRPPAVAPPEGDERAS